MQELALLSLSDGIRLHPYFEKGKGIGRQNLSVMQELALLSPSDEAKCLRPMTLPAS